MDLNQKIRKGGDLNPEESRLVDKMTLSMKPLVETQILYRGISTLHALGIDSSTLTSEGSRYLKKGSIHKLDSFTSTSRNPEHAEWFADGRGALLEIHTNPNTRGITLDNMESGTDEDETILDLNQSIRIKDVITVKSNLHGKLPYVVVEML